jgi:ABC-type transport system involved in multi-copper enzyme maturation permease subunit
MLSDMGSLFRAEWLKIAGNRRVTLFLVWIFPIVAAAVAVLLPVAVLVSTEAHAVFGSEEGAVRLWTELMSKIWSVPNTWFGRMLLIGFATFVFAGEYQWHTWKIIVPRSRRAQLILSKFVVVGAFVLLAFALASLLLAIGTGLAVVIAGGAFGGLGAANLADLIGDYALWIVLTILSTSVATGYAALAGLYTRSILGGVLIGLAAAMSEQFLLLGLIQLGTWLNNLQVIKWYRFVPSYNVENVTSWIKEGIPSTLLFGFSSDSLAFSLAVLAAWCVGLAALAVLLFRRQDITS